MLTLKNVRKSFDTRRVLGGVSFSLGAGQRVALVGENGVGKSTLLKIIAGLETADRGEIRIKKGALIGYLPQEAAFDTHLSALEVLRQLSGVAEIERAKQALESRLEDERTQREYDRLESEYERLGGYAFLARAKTFLDGLMLSKLDLEAPAQLLSGGEKRKLMLAGILMRGVDLLLLDEPTNNLDLPALLWLERYLVASRATILVASHDRRFLDRVVEKVVEIDLAKRQAAMFAGNWSTFAEMKARHLRRERELYRFQEAEKERVVASAEEKGTWIEKARTKKRRDNDKMLRGFKINRAAQKHGATQKAFGSRVKRLNRIEKPFERPPLAFELRFEAIKGKSAIRLSRLVAGYPNGFRTRAISLMLPFGSTWVLLGQNGAGKSTLLKTITGGLEPIQGSVAYAPETRFGDLMQEHENIPRTHTPLQYFSEYLKVFERERVLTLLARFGFTPEFAETRIGALSPGERVRFILATLVERGSTVLILDEPTNHLDLEAIEALEEALTRFPGSLLVVTHDRAFLEHLTVDKILVLEAGRTKTVPNFAAYEKSLTKKTERVLKRLTERLGKRP